MRRSNINTHQMMLLHALISFDAFRSIFPAGTVSGAPKLRAITLVAELEKVKRGPYAGAVGRFNFDAGAMDTCIAIRTMVFKDGAVYLQAGGGIVHDSVEEDEYVETLNKLKANVTCIERAEGLLTLSLFSFIGNISGLKRVWDDHEGLNSFFFWPFFV